VSVAPGLGRSDATIETVRRYGLWPEAVGASDPAGPRTRTLRIVKTRDAREPGERVVESVRDAFGREWAVVVGQRASGPA